MAEKNMKARIIHKHDVAENWAKATSFIPRQGEVIIYDKDSTYNYERMKIGDGVQNVNALPFVDDTLRTVLSTQINAVDDRVDVVSTLVGDTKVSDQIAAAQIVYVGPNAPTDPNIMVWVNTAEEGTGVIPVLPRLATITLAVDGWEGDSVPYTQSVVIDTVTTATKVDLQPTVSQIVSLQNDEIALMAENVEGTVKIYSFGGKPSTDMSMQVLLTEVAFV